MRQIIHITTGMEDQICCTVVRPVHPHGRTDRQVAVPYSALRREIEIGIALIDGGVVVNAI